MDADNVPLTELVRNFVLLSVPIIGLVRKFNLHWIGEVKTTFLILEYIINATELAL